MTVTIFGEEFISQELDSITLYAPLHARHTNSGILGTLT
jgi:hypothetical protein